MTMPQGQTHDGVLSGRYALGVRLGAGGMGEVFAGHDRLLERRVAVKLLPPDLQSDVVARERLRREALAAAALDHPFICKIYEVGEADGRVFIVMGYVERETLHELTRRSMLDSRQILEITTEIAEALGEAHRRGIVHRDLKPAYVMLTTQGHVKVMDFGLAKQIEPDAAHGSGAATMLTDSGTRLGTPAYMSPEQVLGGPLDARSDIFSLGVLLHELSNPLTLEDIGTGLVCNTHSVGPVNPQLAAALAADAAGMTDRAREHFETAAAQARDVPIRLMQPTVLYWYGRSLATHSKAADGARGRAMVEAALADFKTRDMVLHAELAERFLREAP